MGFNVSQYVVQDRFAAEVQEVLKLKPTGETEEFPESPICGAMTPQGSYILYVNDRALNGEELMQPILQCSRVLACTVNETSMVSAAYEQIRGTEIWYVEHDSWAGIEHLMTRGKLPDNYARIREEKLLEQREAGDDVDHIFDVPVELFVEMGGVRYDLHPDFDDPEPWHVLAQNQLPKRSWWPFTKL